MAYPVVKATGYCLVHAPDLVLTHGTTVGLELASNPNSQWAQQVISALPSYQEVVGNPANQCYIGNITPSQLHELPQPWYRNLLADASPQGKFGEILPFDEFIALLKISDAFNLVEVEKEFLAQISAKFRQRKFFAEQQLELLDQGISMEEIRSCIENKKADPINCEGNLVGCVKRAHDSDPTLAIHVVFENLVAKASGVLALSNLLQKNHVLPRDIEYIIETSEEACGDMNQRGGGNFAKAIGEVCGCINATGSDTRAFCAAPAHGIINAASLVQAGVYKNVVVLGGGAVAKLGMNARDHLRKNVPILESLLGGFAVLISRDDGKNPIIRLDAVGRHRIGSGASPQAVTTALVTDPLDKLGYTISDVDKYGVEMQNPEVTVPAGAGNVPLANYKMIGALAVKRGEQEQSKLADFIKEHGMPGWAPTQGHIPSGVPFLGFARDSINSGQIQRAMIIGKGSLFLARMTNLFDGVSFLVEKNPGNQVVSESEQERKIYRVGITLFGSEHGESELLKGAEQAARLYSDLEVVAIGRVNTRGNLQLVPTSSEQEAQKIMEDMIDQGKLHAGVTMHYNFPLGTATIGRVVSPANGREMLVATTTGATNSDRVLAMAVNSVLGVATAQALGVDRPQVGIVNVEGASLALRRIRELQSNGYPIEIAESIRQDGGSLLRGNDIIAGSCNVVVCDSLTGNLLMKMLSSFTSGGNYETCGFGYGPGLGGEDERLILIVSRASGSAVVSNALVYAYRLLKGDVFTHVSEQLSLAEEAGLVRRTQNLSLQRKVVTEEITGIDILELDTAVERLTEAKIYAKSGMGCTGPVVLVAEDDLAAARKILVYSGYLNCKRR